MGSEKLSCIMTMLLPTPPSLAAKKVEVLDHPAYSPDLAPCDFYLFPVIKDRLRGIRFESEDEAFEAFSDGVGRLTPDNWKNCIANWFGRMQHCIDVGGEYFEKQ